MQAHQVREIIQLPAHGEGVFAGGMWEQLHVVEFMESLKTVYPNGRSLPGEKNTATEVYHEVRETTGSKLEGQ